MPWLSHELDFRLDRLTRYFLFSRPGAVSCRGQGLVAAAQADAKAWSASRVRTSLSPGTIVLFLVIRSLLDYDRADCRIALFPGNETYDPP
jgi:hypothetical protein